MHEVWEVHSTQDTSLMGTAKVKQEENSRHQNNSKILLFNTRLNAVFI